MQTFPWRGSRAAKARFAALGFAALTVAACGYTETHSVVLRAPPGPEGHAVELYMGDQPPTRAFYEVALLQVIGHGTDANLEDVTKALSVRGYELGCDAVMRIHVEQGYTMAHGFGVCVKYAAPPSSQPAAPAPTAPAPLPAPTAPPPPPAPSGGVTL